MLRAPLLALLPLAPLPFVLGGDDAAQAQPPEARALALEPVRLERLPSSPRRTLRPARAVEDGLELRGTRFATRLERGVLRVATEPGDDPSRRVRNGSALSFTPLAAGDEPPIALLFERHGGAWVFGAAEARRLELSGLELCLVDVDADGRFDLLHDGWSLGVGGPLLPLSEVLVLDDRELRVERLAREGTELVGRVEPLAGTPAQRAALARLNRLRLGDGLSAVRLEPELAEGCAQHAAYLARRGWAGGDGGNEQDPGAEDTTRAGVAAARKSQVLPLVPAAAIDELWRGLEGRLQLADPDLVAVGISDLDAPIAVIDARSLPARREGAAITYEDVRLSPANGARGRPTHHATDAMASPVEGAAQGGPPLLVELTRGAAGIEAYECELYADWSRRRSLPTRPLPVTEERPGLRGALPKRPLEAGREHLVVHRLTLDGEVRVFEVRFLTQERP